MPKFTYLGDQEAVTPWGIEFPQGVAVSVEDEAIVAKLRGNNHFAEVVDGVEVIAQPARRKPGRPRKDA